MPDGGYRSGARMLLIGREGALAPDPGALRPWFLTAPWLVKIRVPRTQLAECSRAEASWAGVYARRFDKIGKKML